MASITSPARNVDTAAGSASLGHALTAPFRAIGRALIAISKADPRMRQIDRLSRMSDEELAEHGLTRIDALRRIMSGSF